MEFICCFVSSSCSFESSGYLGDLECRKRIDNLIGDVHVMLTRGLLRAALGDLFII